MLCEGEPSQLLAKVLDHIIALEFSMDQYIEPQLLLNTHRAGDFFAYESLIGSCTALSMFPFRASRTHSLALRKRTNGGCRKRRRIVSRGRLSLSLATGSLATPHGRV